MTPHLPRIVEALGTALVLSLAGCSPSDRLDLTGTVTHRSAPVPRGRVVFVPDVAKGNTGSGGSADIVDGRFHTLPNLGPAPGAYVARVTAYDGIVAPGPEGEMSPLGALLFSEVSVPVEIVRGGPVDLVIPPQPAPPRPVAPTPFGLPVAKKR